MAWRQFKELEVERQSRGVRACLMSRTACIVLFVLCPGNGKFQKEEEKRGLSNVNTYILSSSLEAKAKGP